MEGKEYGVSQAKEKGTRQGCEEEGEEMDTRGNSDAGVGREDVGGREQNWRVTHLDKQ